MTTVSADERSAPIPILLYHAITDDPGLDLQRWSVTRRQFRDQLDLLEQEGLTTLTISDYAACLRGARALPERPALITFDDGYLDFIDAAEEMARRGVVSTLYVTTGCLDGSPTVHMPAAPMLGADDLAGLESLGVELGAHAHHHHQVDVAPRSVARDEVMRPKTILEDILGHPVNSFAYPHGAYRRAVRDEVVAAGYTSACAVRNELSWLGDNPFSLARLTVLDTTPTETVRSWLEGRGAPVAREGEHLKTTLWRARRWFSAGAARRQAKG